MSIRTNRRPTVARPATAPQSPRLDDLAARYRRVGLDARAEQLEAVLARVADVDVDVSTLSANLEAIKIRCVFEIINGTKSTAVAAVELATARNVATAAPVVHELAAAAQTQMRYDCAKALWQSGEELIAELNTVVEHSAELIADAAPVVDGITTDAQAVRAPSATAKAWKTMLIESERIRECWSLAFTLRWSGFVSDLREADEADYQWRHPDRVVRPYLPSEPASTTMVRNVSAGAGPCVATADEVLAALFDTEPVATVAPPLRGQRSAPNPAWVDAL